MNDKEIEELATLVSSIQDIYIDELEEDKRIWSWKPQDSTLAGHILRSCAMIILLESFPVQNDLGSWHPPKIQVFFWALAEGKLNSGEVIR